MGLKRGRMPMYCTALIFTASFIFSGFITGKASFAFDENSSASTKSTISPSGETSQERGALQQLAVALAAGHVARTSFYPSKIKVEEIKRTLNPSTPVMDFGVVEIRDYGPLLHSCPAMHRKT